MTETKPTHVEEKVTERTIELTGDDSNAGTQANQEKQGEDVAKQDKPDSSDNDKSDSSDKSE